MNKRTFLVLGIVVALGGGILLARSFFAKTSDSQATAQKKKTLRYQCSMHPGIVSDTPGDCPICQMTLQPVEEIPAPNPQSAQAQVQPKERKILFYRHPMRPDVTSKIPSKDEMGMDFIPVYEDEITGGSPGIQGHAPVRISTERQQRIGVTTETVERRDLRREIRTVGRVAFDPELYNAMAEYREAISAKERIKNSPWPTAKEGADALIRSSALKLRLMGLSDQQIEQIGKNQSDSLNLLLPGKKVWVYAQVYEYEIDLLRIGQEIVVTTSSMPGRVFHGTIRSIDPVLNPTTRTARVRAEIRTPQERLRPESFVNIKIQIPLGKGLAVSDNSILDTGETQIVFVKKGEGEFEPRSVEIGREAQGYVEILKGLQEGEEVVTSANFLIDSESRFKSALDAFVKKGGTP